MWLRCVFGHHYSGCWCVHCGQKSPKESDHVWEGCTCTRCGAERDQEHSFELYSSGSCSNCPYKVTGTDNQSFGCYGLEEGETCTKRGVYVCSKCGRREGDGY